jgi:hydrogenase/urease accessory protein HupE
MIARLACGAVLFVMTYAAPALAHAPISGVDGFPGGLLHPLAAPAHALALVGLGLLIGQQPRRQRTRLLIVFAAALFAALGAIMAAFVFTEGKTVLLAVAAISGILVALARPVPAFAVAVLAALSGIAIEFDSVPAEISISATLRALAGTTIGAALALTFVALASADPRRQWLRIGVRIVGSWTAASAILVLAVQFAR